MPLCAVWLSVLNAKTVKKLDSSADIAKISKLNGDLLSLEIEINTDTDTDIEQLLKHGDENESIVTIFS